MSKDMSGLSRREFIAGAGALAVSTSLLKEYAVAAEIPSNLASPSALGGWTSDSRNLPAYVFTADLPLKTLDGGGKSYPLDSDPFFILGNYRLTVFPKASGLYTVVSGERGWTRLNEPTASIQQNSARIEVTRSQQSEAHELLGLSGVCADAKRSRRQFGCGFVRYDLAPSKETGIVRTLSLAPSNDRVLGQPALVVNVKITNTGATPCDFVYVESILSHVALGIELATPEADKAVTFSNRVEIDKAQSFIISHSSAHSPDPGIMGNRKEANRYNLFPASLVLTYPKGAAQNDRSPAEFSSRTVAPDATYLDATIHGHLAAEESLSMTFIIGLAPDQDPGPTLQFSRELGIPVDGVYFGNDWQTALSKFQSVDEPVFQRELTWNNHALLAMATYNSFYDETFIPQGMTYDYQMDLTAAPRDHLQHSMAAAYFRPSLAKSTIRYVLCKMTAQGEIKYTDFGFGRTSNKAWNTSDQQLYLFQAVGEYLRITGDYEFLNEETTYLPREAGMKGTVLEKLERALTYLREEVATGPHGLVHLMNSDWSDMVFADRSVMRYFFTAESHMNSAMVVAVVPSLIKQVEVYGKTVTGKDIQTVRKILGSLNIYNDRITKAFYADLSDRSFSRRLYFDAQTPFGEDNMHIEPQSFLLQAENYPTDRKRVLWKEVRKRILDGEVLGPRQRQTPVEGGMIGEYVSENGGYWYSLAGQMIIGLATFDKEAAKSVLNMMTFNNFSQHYPSYWTGLWSAADTVNAVPSGSIAGLPRPDNNGLWTTFASFCAHAHAWPIYAWSRINEA
jgi:cellobiose phosphorylase